MSEFWGCGYVKVTYHLGKRFIFKRAWDFQDTPISIQNRHHFLLINLLTPTCYVMTNKFNIQQLNILPTLYLCVLFLSENKQRLLPLTS
jgi:hypothetical protein